MDIYGWYGSMFMHPRMTTKALTVVCVAFASLAFLSQVEPKSFREAESDKNLISSMQEKLMNFERNKV